MSVSPPRRAATLWQCAGGLTRKKENLTHLRHHVAFCRREIWLRFVGAGASLLMVASRNRPEVGLRTSLGLVVMMLWALPSEVGYQDLATLLTRQPVVNRAQKTAFASTFGTIHEAPYNFPEPVGSSIPVPPGYTLAGLDPGHADVTGSLRERLRGGDGAFYATPYVGPVIDRSRKGDYGVASKDHPRP